MARPPSRQKSAKAAQKTPTKKTPTRRRVQPHFNRNRDNEDVGGSNIRENAGELPPQTMARKDSGRQTKSASGTTVWKHTPIKPLNLTTKKVRPEASKSQRQEHVQESVADNSPNVNFSEDVLSADIPKSPQEVMSPQRKVATSIIQIISNSETIAPEHGVLESAAAVATELPAQDATTSAQKAQRDSEVEEGDERPPSSIGACSDQDADSSDSEVEDANSSDSDVEDADESIAGIEQANTPNKSSAKGSRPSETMHIASPTQNEMGKDGSMPQTLESIPMATVGVDNEVYSADIDTVRNAKPIVSNTQNGTENSVSDSSSGSSEDGSADEGTNDEDGDDGSSNDKDMQHVTTNLRTPVLVPGTAADLMILDYISYRILQEVAEFGVVFEKATYNRNSDVLAKLKRIEHLAYEHALVRKQHFTSSLFLQNDQQPGSDFDMLQWGTSMLRINQATFALLVLCPEAVVDDQIDRKLPNHERLLISAGFKAAAGGFFEHVVPTSKRNGNSVSLLVDMQTQQWLAGADDEKQLKSVLDQVREFDEVAIGQLLSMDDASESMQVFDKTAISVYRGNVNQRLNKLSGRRLNTTRSHYKLESVQMRVVSFVGECAEMMTPPVICTVTSAQQSNMDDSFLVDMARDESEVEDDDVQTTTYTQEAHETDDISTEVPTGSADEVEGNGDSQISGDYEVTILKSKADLERIHTISDVASTSNDASVVPETSIDQSFSETRRVASVMRDVANDAHLDELLATIEHEEIDISTADTLETRTRMQLRSRARSLSHTVPDMSDPAPQDSTAEADDDFRLPIGNGGLSDAGEDDDSESKEPRNGSLKTLSERKEDIRQASTRRLRPRRSITRSFVDNEDSDAGNAESAESIIRAMRRPSKRTRVEYRQPDDQETPRSGSKFRGRRGIAAEDPAKFENEDNDVRFTPSVQGTPASSQEQQDGVFEQSEPYMSPGRQLGQYRPVVMVRDEMVQTPPMRGRPARSAGRATPKRKPQPQPQPQSSGPQKRKRWTEEEEECFVRAVHTHGLKWTLILSFHGKHGTVDKILKDRTRQHLKDKARNIKIRLQRDKQPLGPFEFATGGIDV